MAYAIRFDDETNDQLAYLTPRQRAKVFDAVERQLSHEPTVETRNCKRMQMDKPGFIASWELRVGNLRGTMTWRTDRRPLVITAVGVKVRSRVRIGGQEYEA